MHDVPDTFPETSERRCQEGMDEEELMKARRMEGIQWSYKEQNMKIAGE